jgi:hypothetical protein
VLPPLRSLAGTFPSFEEGRSQRERKGGREGGRERGGGGGDGVEEVPAGAEVGGEPAAKVAHGELDGEDLHTS